MNVRRIFAPIFIATAIVTAPMLNKGQGGIKCDVFEKEQIESMHFNIEAALNDFEIVTETNFRGGVFHKYDDSTVQKIKILIQKPQAEIKYRLPIENERNIYLEEFGMFGAKRPGGRPHLGLDIFATRFAKKPKEPVKIVSPIDGVVISHKKAPKNDKNNVIANSIVILGVDGRRYGFDHLARDTDYDETIAMPETGTIIKEGDPIGIVGKTGETALWHLHLAVMTDEEKEFQESDPIWQELTNKTGYAPLKGQVDPLNREKAGPIADLLNEYRK